MIEVIFHLPDGSYEPHEVELNLKAAFSEAENVSVKQAEPERRSSNRYFRQGYSEGFCAMGPKENPYQPGSEAWHLWEEGWAVGQEET